MCDHMICKILYSVPNSYEKAPQLEDQNFYNCLASKGCSVSQNITCRTLMMSKGSWMMVDDVNSYTTLDWWINSVYISGCSCTLHSCMYANAELWFRFTLISGCQAVG
jgi:hypothetical protein